MKEEIETTHFEHNLSHGFYRVMSVKLLFVALSKL